MSDEPGSSGPGERPHFKLGEIVRSGFGKAAEKQPDGSMGERLRRASERPRPGRWVALAGIAMAAAVLVVVAGRLVSERAHAVGYLVEGAGGPIGQGGGG